MNKRAFSPAGRRIDFCIGNPLAIMFDKGVLLRVLLGEAQKSSVVTMAGALGARVENQGALMCGYHAGNAAARELLGESGFDEYCSWWQKSFEFFSPEVNRVAHGFAINPHYEDEEIDYLFSLVEGKTLAGTIVQYKTPKIMWDAILEHRERITTERPALIDKIDALLKLTVQEALSAGAGKN
jgi:hypothetical protein